MRRRGPRGREDGGETRQLREGDDGWLPSGSLVRSVTRVPGPGAVPPDPSPSVCPLLNPLLQIAPLAFKHVFVCCFWFF